MPLEIENFQTQGIMTLEGMHYIPVRNYWKITNKYSALICLLTPLLRRNKTNKVKEQLAFLLCEEGIVINSNSSKATG